VVNATDDGDKNVYVVDSNGDRTGEIIARTDTPIDFMGTDDSGGGLLSKPNGAPVVIDMNNLRISGTMRRPDERGKESSKEYAIASAGVHNATLADLIDIISDVYNEEVQRQGYGDIYNGTFLLRDMSAGGEILDVKVSLGVHKYTPILVSSDADGVVITTLRAAGNIAFGNNMRNAQPLISNDGLWYSLLMGEVGSYNQSHNNGNGYNKGYPYYGEHTYIQWSIYLLWIFRETI
jgi:hypothetical protein